MRSAYHQPAFGGDSLGCSDRAACSIVTVYLERMISTFTKFRVQAPISAIFSVIHFRDLLPLLGRDGDLGSTSGCVPSFGVLLFWSLILISESPEFFGQQILGSSEPGSLGLDNTALSAKVINFAHCQMSWYPKTDFRSQTKCTFYIHVAVGSSVGFY